jgi:hypothetical protein
MFQVGRDAGGDKRELGYTHQVVSKLIACLHISGKRRIKEVEEDRFVEDSVMIVCR